MFCFCTRKFRDSFDNEFDLICHPGPDPGLLRRLAVARSSGYNIGRNRIPTFVRMTGGFEVLRSFCPDASASHADVHYGWDGRGKLKVVEKKAQKTFCSSQYFSVPFGFK